MLTVAAVVAAGLAPWAGTLAAGEEPGFRLGTFSADVTCPVGHPLLGGIIAKANKIVDPLDARGLVLLGGDEPVVFCAIEWCEIRNRSYDAWRKALAEAAGTRPERVLLSSVHQHDAPLTDAGAAELLAEAGLPGAMFDPEFERKCIERVAAAVRQSVKQARPITHLGMGKAEVERIASNRRVIRPDGTVTYQRGSNSGRDPFYREAPTGQIDPWLRTLSFWNEQKPLAALHVYAVHPMSYYGRGGVSADFVGRARRLMQREHPGVFHVYASGCSGDVTAGKYNDGSPANRPMLAERLYRAMKAAWSNQRRLPLKTIEFRTTPLRFRFRPVEKLSEQRLTEVLHDRRASVRNRVLAAMGLASRRRVQTGQPIDFACLDFGAAQIVLFPGETFVGYQLAAQQLRPDSFVVCVGYGECWPGYIPTTQGFADHFDDVWHWVAPGSDRVLEEGMKRVLNR